MQREIKFRAWDDDQKEMATDLVVYGDGIFEVALDYCGACSQKKYGLPDSIGMTTDKRWVLMQFTGLKDKNGKEIWESDILCYTKADGQKHYYEVFWNIEKGAWRMRSNNTEMALWDNATRHEIVGNLYQHPSLLTPTRKAIV